MVYLPKIKFSISLHVSRLELLGPNLVCMSHLKVPDIVEPLELQLPGLGGEDVDHPGGWRHRLFKGWIISGPKDPLVL